MYIENGYGVKTDVIRKKITRKVKSEIYKVREENTDSIPIENKKIMQI